MTRHRAEMSVRQLLPEALCINVWLSKSRQERSRPCPPALSLCLQTPTPAPWGTICRSEASPAAVNQVQEDYS